MRKLALRAEVVLFQGFTCTLQSKMFDFSPFHQKRKRMIDDETRFASS
jgi:hypothetical protein